jgi:hypothetical protein
VIGRASGFQVVARLLALAWVVAATACADRTLGGRRGDVLQASDLARLEHTRLFLVAIIAVQYAVMLTALRKSKTDPRYSHLFRSLLLLPLAWTKLGEWWYQLWHWSTHHGNWGILIAAILFTLTGFMGVGNLTMLVLAGFVFLDADLISYTVVPSLISATLVDLSMLAQTVSGQPRERTRAIT